MLQTPYVYVFVRTDLAAAYQIVQANHACFEMGIQLANNKRPSHVSHMVLCSIPGEEELQKISLYLTKNKIDHHMFYEPDNDTGYTAICCEPVYDEQRKLFKKFRLLK